MRKGVLIFAPLTIFTAVIVACGASERRSGFGEGGDGGFEGSTGFTPGQVPCAGLACKVVTDCADGAQTTLTGKVYDPAGSNPLYNVMVYIPGGASPEDLPPMKDSTQDPDGITCETCSSIVLNPLTSALTDGTGTFTLDKVPVDSNVPVVIQVGKWRRLMHVDVTKKCTENKVPDREFSLPKNSSEGNMPQIAVTSGGYDALECLLRGVGIDDSEFVMGDDPGGHVHVFKGSGGGMGTPAEDFWNDSAQLKKYDMLLLSCEGQELLTNKGGNSTGARQSFVDYLNAGGKAFATHYHYVWFKNSPDDNFKGLANWTSAGDFATSYDVNQSFPKGEQFAKWLKSVGASSTLGKIQLEGATDSVKSINDPALAWIQGTKSPKYFSVNAPLDADPTAQCGRAVFSDVHITDSGETSSPTAIDECSISKGGLNAQQKALEFLFFDLSACVSDDHVDPSPPK